MTQSYCILGNPNVGKTSLFNALTGSYEYIGNWSGVTVEKKVGKLKDNVGDLVDLPGIYDLSPISKDETVVTDYLMSTSFTGMINIIDACQLKRNLNLYNTVDGTQQTYDYWFKYDRCCNTKRY